MDDAEHDGHLHLVRVREHQRIVRLVPGGVQTERIDVTSGLGNDRAVGLREAPPRVPDVQRLGEDVVVHEAGIHGEDAHEQDDVPPAVNNALLALKRGYAQAATH